MTTDQRPASLPEYLERLDPDMQARIQAMHDLETIQRADAERVESRSVERFVFPPHSRKTRRARQVVTVSLHPTYLPSNIGFAKQQVCQSLFRVYDMHAGPFNDFHGADDLKHPTIWKVREAIKRPAHSSTTYWCDAHLPAEYREMFQQEALI